MTGVQVLSYELIKNWSRAEKLEKILIIVKGGDVVMLEGKLAPEDETELISRALANVSGRFTGIEVAFLNSSRSTTILGRVKDTLINVLAKDRIGITVVGPSKIIKEIKMDPNKLEILFK
ncbi:MAG: DUF2073 domain-containing protein [Candidatus Woesearchaeota archaeon]|jgi:hypothetical protein|nr:DUF2073 domain-containing protein [Candidatus Woesearchaeota archaeon]